MIKVWLHWMDVFIIRVKARYIIGTAREVSIPRRIEIDVIILPPMYLLPHHKVMIITITITVDKLKIRIPIRLHHRAKVRVSLRVLHQVINGETHIFMEVEGMDTGMRLHRPPVHPHMVAVMVLLITTAISIHPMLMLISHPLHLITKKNITTIIITVIQIITTIVIQISSSSIIHNMEICRRFSHHLPWDWIIYH